MNSIAIDLGGTRIKTALIHDGAVVCRDMLPACSGNGLRERLPVLEKAVRGMAGSALSSCSCVGIAYPGLVHPKEKRILSASGKYTDGPELDLAAWCDETFGLPIALENDANAALLGETAYGCAQGCRDAVLMILGTGVGTAAMMDGRLIRGRHFQAGCLGGHFPVRAGERDCTCGHKGCVEANASSWALPELAREHPLYAQSGLKDEPVLDFITLEKHARRKDACALSLLDRCIAVWGSGIVAMLYAYDPETVILSGGVTRMGDILLRPLAQYVWDNAWTPWGKARFLVSRQPEQSALLGLHDLCMNSKPMES